MKNIQRAIAQARGRMVMQSWLTALGWLSLGGLLLGGLLLVTSRLVGVELPLVTYAAIALFVLTVAPLLAYSRRPGSDEVAALVDHRLNLKDRLGTALYVKSIKDNAFAAQVVAEAEKAASSLTVREGFAIRMRRVWHYVPLLAAMVALLAAFVPYMDVLGWQEQKALERRQQAQAELQRDQVERVIATMQTFEQSDVDLADADPLDPMKELADLTKRDLTNPEMRQQMAAKLSAVQERLTEKIDQTEAEFRTVKNTLSRLKANEYGPADQFADALRRGDFKAAQDALEKLVQDVEQMNSLEKQQLQQQLEDLAQQLQQMAQQQAQQQARQQQQMQQQLQQALQQQGMSQQQAQQQAQQLQQQMQQGMTQQQLQQALQQQGMSQQQAQQMAQQMQQQMQQMQNSSQAQGQCQGLGQSMQQMAQQIQQGGGQGMGPSAFQANQQLQQMAQMQQLMQQMQLARSQANQAMNSMSPSSGRGGQKAGTGDGGNPFGMERQMPNVQSRAESDIQQRQGRVIASWLEKGEMAKGNANVAFNTAVTEARKDAEQAVTDDRVPRRYHESIKKYFNQLPESTENIRAPAAPR